MSLDLDDDAGVDIRQYDATEHQEGSFETTAGFAPACVVVLDPAWVASEAVARELALAVEGVVWCDVDEEILFDAKGIAEPCGSRQELESRLERAFERAGAAWAEEEALAAKADEDRFARAKTEDPTGVATDNDWSDL